MPGVVPHAMQQSQNQNTAQLSHDNTHRNSVQRGNSSLNQMLTNNLVNNLNGQQQPNMMNITNMNFKSIGPQLHFPSLMHDT